MGISQSFAVPHDDDRENVEKSRELIFSCDVRGNIIEVNDAAQRIMGYSSDEARGMNISALIGPAAPDFIPEEILGQIDGSPRHFEVNALARNGRYVKLAVTRQVVLERGGPIAFQDICRPIASLAHSSEPASDPPEHLASKSLQLAHFAEQLKQLNRLSTTRYDSLEQAFEDHLKTGCRLFGLPVGMILQLEGDAGLVRAVYGSTDLQPGARLRASATHGARVAGRLRTHTSSKTNDDQDLLPEFEIYIGTPILLGSELFGTLSFSSSSNGPGRNFLEAEAELIELMARSIARYILDQRVQARHQRSAHLEENRSQVLEMVAANHALEFTLNRVVHMIENQRPGVLCSVLLRNGGALFWAVATGFPNDTIRLSKPVRLSPEPSELGAARLARSTIFWQEVRDCPVWAERSYFAVQIGISSVHVDSYRLGRRRTARSIGDALPARPVPPRRRSGSAAGRLPPRRSRHRTARVHRAAGIPGPPRFADRFAEPRLLHRAPGEGAGGSPPPFRNSGRAIYRSRSFQADQRHARPRHGRPAAEGSRR